MQETGNNTIIREKIYGESFSGFKAGGGTLFLLCNEDGFSCAVAGKSRSEFIALESFFGDKSSTTEISTWIRDSEICNLKGYRQIICSFGFPKVTLVPDALFDENSIRQHLSLCSEILPDEEILFDEIHQIRAKAVYAVPHSILNLLQSHFPGLESHHISNSFITHAMLHHAQRGQAVMSLNMNSGYFEIAVSSDRQFLFYNSFPAATPEEGVYHLLFICEQLRLDPESVILKFSGSIDENNGFLKLASNYIRHTGFVKRPSGYQYDQALRFIPAHQHFQLFIQPVCVS
jgi:hypothetical protein